MKKVYFACALKNAPQEFIDECIKLRQQLKNKFEVLEFVLDQNSTPSNLYENDILYCVKNADFLVAVLDYPSLGVGYEIATAVERYNKKVLGFATEGAVVSSLIQGIPTKNFTFTRVKSISDIINYL